MASVLGDVLGALAALAIIGTVTFWVGYMLVALTCGIFRQANKDWTPDDDEWKGNRRRH